LKYDAAYPATGIVFETDDGIDHLSFLEAVVQAAHRIPFAAAAAAAVRIAAEFGAPTPANVGQRPLPAQIQVLAPQLVVQSIAVIAIGSADAVVRRRQVLG